jgi:signal transduction histidine kinase
LITPAGAGIAPKDLPRIFDRFERGASPRTYGGLGLGLYIAREIVEAHGGSISVESEPGAGSTFVIEIPCAPPSTSSKAPIAGGHLSNSPVS